VLAGLGHVDLVCRDLERSLAFYAAVFGQLGLEAPFLIEGERGEQIHYLRFSGSIGLRQALEAQEFELYAPGFHRSGGGGAAPAPPLAAVPPGVLRVYRCRVHRIDVLLRVDHEREVRSSSTRTASGSRWRRAATRAEE